MTERKKERKNEKKRVKYSILAGKPANINKWALHIIFKSLVFIILCSSIITLVFSQAHQYPKLADLLQCTSEQ